MGDVKGFPKLWNLLLEGVPGRPRGDWFRWTTHGAYLCHANWIFRKLLSCISRKLPPIKKTAVVWIESWGVVIEKSVCLSESGVISIQWWSETIPPLGVSTVVLHCGTSASIFPPKDKLKWTNASKIDKLASRKQVTKLIYRTAGVVAGANPLERKAEDGEPVMYGRLSFYRSKQYEAMAGN